MVLETFPRCFFYDVPETVTVRKVQTSRPTLSLSRSFPQAGAIAVKALALQVLLADEEQASQVGGRRSGSRSLDPPPGLSGRLFRHGPPEGQPLREVPEAVRH